MRFKNTMTSEGAHACLSDRLLIIQYPFENYHSRSSLLPDFIFGTYHLMPGYITNTTMRGRLLLSLLYPASIPDRTALGYVGKVDRIAVVAVGYGKSGGSRT